MIITAIWVSGLRLAPTNDDSIVGGAGNVVLFLKACHELGKADLHSDEFGIDNGRIASVW